jgi:effector-binding domain-containing protein
MSYMVEIKELAPVRVAYKTHKGLVMEANRLFPAVFRAIRKTNGTPFFLYHEMDAATKRGVVDVCEATAEESTDPAVKIKEVPGVRALVARHVGPYDTVFMAYQAISKYAVEHGIKLATPSRELFLKGPTTEKNPAKFVTDVVVPIG